MHGVDLRLIQYNLRRGSLSSNSDNLRWSETVSLADNRKHLLRDIVHCDWRPNNVRCNEVVESDVALLFLGDS